MACPICGRLYCDHSPAERGQTQEEMFQDMTSPHIAIGGTTQKVSPEDYEAHTGTKWYGATTSTPARISKPARKDCHCRPDAPCRKSRICACDITKTLKGEK